MNPGRLRPPRVIPVLDVMNGQVVRAVGGRRDEYRPIQSRLTDSTEPWEVAQAMMSACGVRELYVADLDAILGHTSLSWEIDDLISPVEFPTWVDAGISPGKDVDIFPVSRHIRPVIGFETADEPGTLARAISMSYTPVAFSIDLKAGGLYGNWYPWGAETATDALAVARTAVATGVRTLIVLDLARVGTGGGCGTEALLRAIRDAFPAVELIAGGGVRTWDDVDRLGDAGADAVLVASALHDGTLGVPQQS
jgi:phosphoribosylformimino-5-aminoimidazole carboxamide ribotide isomerase